MLYLPYTHACILLCLFDVALRPAGICYFSMPRMVLYLLYPSPFKLMIQAVGCLEYMAR